PDAEDVQPGCRYVHVGDTSVHVGIPGPFPGAVAPAGGTTGVADAIIVRVGTVGVVDADVDRVGAAAHVVPAQPNEPTARDREADTIIQRRGLGEVTGFVDGHAGFRQGPHIASAREGAVAHRVGEEQPVFVPLGQLAVVVFCFDHHQILRAHSLTA